MNDNFDKDIGTPNNNLGQEPNKSSVYDPRVNGSTYKQAQNNQPYYTPSYYGNYDNKNQYMPYGSYVSYTAAEAEKKPSKGKKVGTAVAVTLIVIGLFIAMGVLAMTYLYGANPNSNLGDDNNAKLEFTATPNNTGNNSDGNYLSASDVYKKIHESSVGILVYSGNRQQVMSEGSGVVLGLNGDNTGSYIITCTHVIDVSNPRVVVQDINGTQYQAQIVGKDSKTDIGVIFVANTSFKAAEFADSDTLEVGDTIYAIGNPGGTQFFGSFTNGMVSAIGRPVDSPVGYEVPCIQHTAAINPGNSGGALVNEYGQVVGINSSKIASTDFEGMGFAVPTTTVKEVVDELIKNGAVTNRPALGVTVFVATSDRTYYNIVQTNNLPDESVVIESILNGSDLKNQDVQVGDIIIAINGKDLISTGMVPETIENSKVGDTVTLKIGRVGDDLSVTTFDVEVKLVSDITLSE